MLHVKIFHMLVLLGLARIFIGRIRPKMSTTIGNKYARNWTVVIQNSMFHKYSGTMNGSMFWMLIWKDTFTKTFSKQCVILMDNPFISNCICFLSYKITSFPLIFFPLYFFCFNTIEHFRSKPKRYL